MIGKNRSKKILSLGKLISALYDEAASITRNRRLQTLYVCLALMDMQRAQ